LNSSKPPGWQIAAVLTIGVLSVSTAAIFIRLALADSGSQGVGFSLVLAASRLTIASLCLIPAWRSFRSAQFQPSALYYSAAAGLFLAIHFACWITSLSYTSIAASTALVTTNPVWVALWSWLWFREKPSSLTLGGIAIALLGSVVVAIGDAGDGFVGSHPLLGNSLALIGSWAVSLYFLLGRSAQRRGLGISSHVVLTYTTAALVLLPLPFLFGSSYSGYPISVYGWIVLMAVFPQLIGHTSFNWAVRWVSPTLVTLTILAEPVGSSILGAIVFRENPGVVVIAGAVVIVAGVAIAALGTREA
jgi:drug/metabolite transporter (DMT)-like permease